MKAEFGNLEQIKMLQREQRDKEAEADSKRRKRYESPMEEFIDLEFDLGWHYFAISKIQEDLNKSKPKNAIEIMIDIATGYSQGITAEAAKNVLAHIRYIKRLKLKLNKKFGSEYKIDGDVAFIEKLKLIGK